MDQGDRVSLKSVGVECGVTGLHPGLKDRTGAPILQVGKAMLIEVRSPRPGGWGLGRTQSLTTPLRPFSFVPTNFPKFL